MIVGVDPGVTGALALLDNQRLVDIVDIVDMPVVAGQVDAYTLTGVLADWGAVDRVVIETQRPMPRQGVTSTFTNGCNYGRILGVCAALQRPVTHVPASQWTRALRVGADKAVHRRRAMDEWPAIADRFARAKDDGRADAALIGLWAAIWTAARS